MSTTLIIIPAYNEDACIGQTLQELLAQNLDCDVVVINDGSHDRTADEAAQAGVNVVTLPFNLGYGVAVETGFKYAIRHGYSHVVLFDADGQHGAEFIAQMLETMRREKVNIVIGSRFRGRAEYKISGVRRIGMMLFQRVVQMLTGSRILDITSGFQVIDKAALQFLAGGNYPVDYPDSDVIVDLLLAGFRVCEFPVVVKGRAAGVSMHTSKLKNLYYIYKMFLALFLVVLRHKTQSRR